MPSQSEEHEQCPKSGIMCFMSVPCTTDEASSMTDAVVGQGVLSASQVGTPHEVATEMERFLALFYVMFAPTRSEVRHSRSMRYEERGEGTRKGSGACICFLL